MSIEQVAAGALRPARMPYRTWPHLADSHPYLDAEGLKKAHRRACGDGRIRRAWAELVALEKNLLHPSLTCEQATSLLHRRLVARLRLRIAPPSLRGEEGATADRHLLERFWRAWDSSPWFRRRFQDKVKAESLATRRALEKEGVSIRGLQGAVLGVRRRWLTRNRKGIEAALRQYEEEAAAASHSCRAQGATKQEPVG